MKISVFGSGYVGLVTGICLAEVGNQVICVDVDATRIAQLQQGKLPIYEPQLEPLLKTNLASGRIIFTSDYATAVQHGQVQYIAVGTPPNEDGSTDLQYIWQVADNINKYLNNPSIIVIKSTVPVGTADKLQEQYKSSQITVVSNPEFLKEGAAVDDFMKPERIIIGSQDDNATAILRELYSPFTRSHERFIIMDRRSAELTKYAANAMLATKISFMNELAIIAEALQADIEQVRLGIGSDSRIGFDFIYPGLGFGGSCLPKDIQSLISTARAINIEPKILSAVWQVNQQQAVNLFNKIKTHFNGDLHGKCFALWGLAFKPNTDDMRAAPSRTLMELLWQHGALVQAYDPQAQTETARIYAKRDDLRLCNTAQDALIQAHALIIATEWREFRSPDLSVLKKHLQQPVVFDGRNLYSPRKMQQAGFSYYAVGRGLHNF